jgi:hypothetical protein
LRERKLLFAMPLPERLQQSIHSTRAWLHSTTLTVNICKINYEQEMALQHNDIRQFLPPAPAPTTILNIDYGDSDSESDFNGSNSSNSSGRGSSDQSMVQEEDSTTCTEPEGASEQHAEPRAARRFIARQMKLTAFNFRQTARRQQQTAPAVVRQAAARVSSAQQETNVENPNNKSREQHATNPRRADTRQTAKDARIWDTTRTEREAGGNAMATTKYRNNKRDGSDRSASE